jgi:hypothetical protein
MTRKDDRQAAAAVLTGLGVFQQVYAAPVREFGGQSPVVVVLGATLIGERLTRGTTWIKSGITVTFYTRNNDGDTDAEDTHDDLVEQSIAALQAAGFEFITTDAAPDGAPLRNIDEVYYRTERATLRRV